MPAKISVLIATRNRSNHLLRSVRSICHQTYPFLEILIADDFSTDATSGMLKKLALLDSRIKPIKNNKVIGLAASLNRLLSLSQGDYIARMDDDDVSYANRLAAQLEFMKMNQLDVCGTWYRRVGPVGRSIMRPPVHDNEIKAELLFQPPLLHPSIMIRRSVFERHGGYRNEFVHAEDYEFWTRIAPYVRFGNIPEVLMDYSISKQQVSRKHNTDQVKTARLIRARYLSDLKIPHDNSQLSIHVSLRDPTPIRSFHELNAIGEWLGVLSLQFPPEVRSVFGRQWHLACVRAAGIGLKSYHHWKRSPLAIHTNIVRRLQLAMLCFFRLPYRSLVYEFVELFANG